MYLSFYHIFLVLKVCELRNCKFAKFWSKFADAWYVCSPYSCSFFILIQLIKNCIIIHNLVFWISENDKLANIRRGLIVLVQVLLGRVGVERSEGRWMASYVQVLIISNPPPPPPDPWRLNPTWSGNWKTGQMKSENIWSI